ncbi:MAG TPA: hypothetical protein VIN75_07205 [Burkholderiaceae bacterium]
MDSRLSTIKARRGVPVTELGPAVRRVVVVLCGSRGGSSLFKEALAQHPQVASLDGELDPLLALSGNGFNHNSDSDCLEAVANASELASSILDEISLPSPEILETALLQRKWRNRLALQFPSHFLDPQAYDRLEQSLQAALSRIDRADRRNEADLQRLILASVFSEEPWRIGYYDGNAALGDSRHFDEPLKIEEPPFVMPTLRRRPFTPSDARDAVLLFKSPSDAYRIGMYERLFPNAEVTYIHLTRGYAQSVNGLMDGWLYPLGFFSHDLSKVGCELAIRGYSDQVSFGRKWWKFDLPRNWRRFTQATLEEVCLNQWYSIHAAILRRGVCSLRVSFEDFVASPASVLRRVTDHLGLPAMALPGALPVKMATDQPRPGRWHKRAAMLIPLSARPDVRTMMAMLGYSMDEATWL